MLTPEMDLQHAQERILHDRQAQVPGHEERAAAADQKAASWVEHFGHLAQRLGLAIP